MDKHETPTTQWNIGGKQVRSFNVDVAFRIFVGEGLQQFTGALRRRMEPKLWVARRVSRRRGRPVILPGRASNARGRGGNARGRGGIPTTFRRCAIPAALRRRGVTPVRHLSRFGAPGDEARRSFLVGVYAVDGNIGSLSRFLSRRLFTETAFDKFICNRVTSWNYK